MNFLKTKISIIFICCFAAFLVPQFALAATRYWVGSAGGDVTDTANWSATAHSACGTNGGASVPGNSDDLVFEAECTNSAMLDEAIFWNALTIESGYTGTFTVTGNLVLFGAFSQAGGTLTGDATGSAYFNFQGPAVLSGGILNGSKNTDSFLSSLTISGGTLNTGAGNMEIDGDFTLTSGTLNANGAIYTYGNWTKTGGTFNPGVYTVGFFDTGAHTITSGGTAFYDVNFNFGIYTLQDAFSINNLYLTFTSTLDAKSGGNFPVTIGADFDMTSAGGGVLIARQGTVTFSSGTHTIMGAATFYNLTLTPNNTVTFPASTTQTIQNNFVCAGTSGNLINLNSSSPATAAILSKSSGAASCDYLSFQDIAATGGAFWDQGVHSTSISGNSGWSTDTTIPTVNAGQDQSKSAQFTQDATASDSDSGIASYLWTKISGSGTITFGSATAASTTISANAGGDYVIRLTVTDNVGNSASDDFTLTWVISSPPAPVVVGHGGAAIPIPSSTPPQPQPSISTFPPIYLLPRYLGRGDYGEDVTKLQELLKQLGFFTVTPNGLYGPITQNAVAQFQIAHNLTPTGNVGIKTKLAVNIAELSLAIADLKAQIMVLMGK